MFKEEYKNTVDSKHVCVEVVEKGFADYVRRKTTEKTVYLITIEIKNDVLLVFCRSKIIESEHIVGRSYWIIVVLEN